MKNLFAALLTLLVLGSCNKTIKTEITLNHNSTNWVGTKDFYFEKELILCGVDSAADIILTKKLNKNDTILNGTDNSNNRFIYSTRPNEAGFFEIQGKVITQGKELNFSQYIRILPKVDPIGFKSKNATNLKVGVKNEVQIVCIPKNRILKTDNGQIIESDGKIIIIPERTGNCEIEIELENSFDKQIILT